METPLTIAEAAKRLQLSISTIYKYTESGKIPSYKIGNSIRIAESELEQYFLSCKVKKSRKEEHNEGSGIKTGNTKNRK
jgi:excisionase family DNA binding protein